MKRIFNYVSTVVTRLKPIAIVAACVLMIFASAAPALAIGGFGGANSNPDKGLEQLDSVQKKSERAIAGPNSGEGDAKNKMDVENAEKGLNGVQGDANREKMYSNQNSEGKTIEGNIKNALEEVAP
jgi:hypothetical protein